MTTLIGGLSLAALGTLAFRSDDGGQGEGALAPQSAPAEVPQELESLDLPDRESGRREAISAAASEQAVEQGSEAPSPEPSGLPCEDPLFVAEFPRHRDAYFEAVRCAIDHGYDPASLVPPELRDIAIVTIADRIREALKEERPGIVDGQLFEMASQLRFFLRDRLDAEGVPPYLGDLPLPPNYVEGAPNQRGSFVHQLPSGEERLVFFDVVNGQLAYRLVPPEWAEGVIILALLRAQETVRNVDVEK